MEIGEDFAFRAAEEDEDYSESGSDASDNEDQGMTKSKGKGKERETESRARGARRSDRTKRRDFSIVWSGLKRCFQLFLGPARFLNVSGSDVSEPARTVLTEARLRAKRRTFASRKIRDLPGVA